MKLSDIIYAHDLYLEIMEYNSTIRNNHGILRYIENDSLIREYSRPMIYERFDDMTIETLLNLHVEIILLIDNLKKEDYEILVSWFNSIRKLIKILKGW